jgi:N-acetylmuramoyl-L-alanine amidase
MRMRRLEDDKRRMIREAIQSDIEGRLGKAHKVRVQGRISRWLWASFLSVTAVLAMPSFVTSRGKASLSVVKANTTTAQSFVAEPAPEPAVPLPEPSDVNLAVLPLAVKRIVIDPGHGGEQAGAISNTGLAEKNVTLDIALRLRQLMDRSPFEAILTRETDQTVSLADRVAFANSRKADLFVSIHINWMEPRSIRPLETYYVGPSRDPHVLQLATIENRESGYSLSEYHQLVEKVFLDTRRNESHLLANRINAELYRSLRQRNPELQDRGVKMAPFAVLVGTQMPAVLAEVSSLSNDDDDQLLKDEEYRQQIAVALFRGITAYANNLNDYRSKGTNPDGKTRRNDLCRN